MLLKIFSRGKGTGNAPIDYLLGDNFMASGMNMGELRAGARIVSGNPLITQEMINSSNFARRYTAGVLSFEESPDELTEDTKQAIIQDFEKALFPGMAPDRYNLLWVEHTDKLHPVTKKPRLELNFLIPNTELYTGKRLQPYFHIQDAKYFRSWQTCTNSRFLLSDPSDVSHARVVNPYDSNQSPKTSHKSLKQHIEEYMRFKLLTGKIKNRKDVVREIERMPDTELKVTRESPKFISVTAAGSHQPIRLKGLVFEEGFDYTHWQANLVQSPNGADQTKLVETEASKQQRLAQAQADFRAIYDHKATQNQKKYGILLEERESVAMPLDYSGVKSIAEPAVKQDVNLSNASLTDTTTDAQKHSKNTRKLGF